MHDLVRDHDFDRRAGMLDLGPAGGHGILHERRDRHRRRRPPCRAPPRCRRAAARARPFRRAAALPPESCSPYFLTRSGSSTTPSARLPAAAPITDTGVRSSCDTAATNSSCCRASRSARRADTTISPIAVASSARMPELRMKLRVRAAATAASSDPARCLATSRQCPSPPGNARPCTDSAAAIVLARFDDVDDDVVGRREAVAAGAAADRAVPHAASRCGRRGARRAP